MEENSGVTASSESGPKKERSPSFPFITLTKGLSRTRQLYTAAKRHDMRLADAAGAMNYGAKSSGAIQTLAALKAYGLVDDNGSGDDRKFRVSDLGFKALEDLRPGAKEAALAQAALAPKAIASYAQNWKDGRPDDAICLSDLRFDDGFTEDGAKKFLKVFDDAMLYTKAVPSDKETDTENDNSGTINHPDQKLEVGDLVDVDANGQTVFEKTRIRAIDPPWVFVEASQTGAKMEDITLLEKGGGEVEQPPVLPLNTEREIKGRDDEMDRFTVDEGVVKIAFPPNMTEDSVEELEQFFNLFIKKAKRRAGAEKKAN